MALRQIKPDLILSSLALRAQITADTLAKRLDYKGRIHYMEELYMVRPEKITNILSLQDNQHESIFLVGHNPELTEYANSLIDENLSKLPTLGIIGIKLDIDNWGEIYGETGEIELFVYPKQFRYYMPQQIRKHIENEN
jgi:phosphohistidine phosphatase